MPDELGTTLSSAMATKARRAMAFAAQRLAFDEFKEEDQSVACPQVGRCERCRTNGACQGAKPNRGLLVHRLFASERHPAEPDMSSLHVPSRLIPHHIPGVALSQFRILSRTSSCCACCGWICRSYHSPLPARWLARRRRTSARSSTWVRPS